MYCICCGVCCQETEMLLLEEDIERLERRGYRRDSFVLLDKEGYAKLRNLQGHCVFYDPENRQCKVYDARPYGCRLYPVIYVENEGIRVDNICHAKGKFNEKSIAQRGKKVFKLLERIDKEAKGRCNAE